MGFRTILTDRLASYTPILQPTNENGLQDEHENKRDQKRQHASEGLILEYIEPAIGVVESVEKMVQHVREIL
jgi:hypothetical protein